MNKLQWNFNQNFNIFIQENAFESVDCEMKAILSRPQCVNEQPVSKVGATPGPPWSELVKISFYF